jgi:hypothetical protein
MKSILFHSNYFEWETTLGETRELDEGALNAGQAWTKR